MDWTSGYITDIAYTHGYYREISPAMMDLILLLNSTKPPRRRDSHYLELGYGQGFSLNIHAAANTGTFFGTDFNPAHTVNAQILAAASGADLHLFDDSFEQLRAREALPKFDYITLHGIWSWISDDNRQAILDIIDRNLNVGGVVYISYNALPGWAAAMPLRHLLALHAETAGSDAEGQEKRIRSAIGFGKKLDELKAKYFAHNKTSADRLEKIAEQDHHYIAHEYFNQHWQPMYFSEVSERLVTAKLEFSASANALDIADHLHFNQEQAAFLNTFAHANLRQTVRDFLLNVQFRRDLFVRGSYRLSAFERMQMLKETKFTLLKPTEDDFNYQVHTGYNTAKLRKDIYEPILAYLAADHFKPKSFASMLDQPWREKLREDHMLEALIVLVGASMASPVQDDDAIASARNRCQLLNRHIQQHSEIRGDLVYLASPVVGEGVHVGRFEQMFLRARANGAKEPAQWAQYAWDVMKRLKQTLIKNGKTLSTEAENLADLTEQAENFARKRLALLEALGVAQL